MTEEKDYSIIIADYLGMTGCVVGSLFLITIKGLPMFLLFLCACFCFGYIGFRKKLWGMMIAQGMCFVMNVIGIIQVFCS